VSPQVTQVCLAHVPQFVSQVAQVTSPHVASPTQVASPQVTHVAHVAHVPSQVAPRQVTQVASQVASPHVARPQVPQRVAHVASQVAWPQVTQFVAQVPQLVAQVPHVSAHVPGVAGHLPHWVSPGPVKKTGRDDEPGRAPSRTSMSNSSSGRALRTRVYSMVAARRRVTREACSPANGCWSAGIETTLCTSSTRNSA
jgi:hypothetical protein